MAPRPVGSDDSIHPPQGLRAAVATMASVMPDRARAVAVVHGVWFLALCQAADRLPMEAPAADVNDLALGRPEGTLRIVRAWFATEASTLGTEAGCAALAIVCRQVAGVPAVPSDLGRTYESLVRDGRKQSGRYYTAPELVTAVVAPAFERSTARRDSLAWCRLTVCDPACGGGAFLLAALDWLAAVGVSHGVDQARARSLVLARCLHGMDLDPGAAAVTAMSLWLAAGRQGGRFARVLARVRCADALAGTPMVRERTVAHVNGTDWRAAFPRAWGRAEPGFDVVIGNPPWVAFAGRATGMLSLAHRGDLRTRYAGFGGYPTLHGAFLDRASAWLRPGGVLGLLLPSAMADLKGYGPARTALTARCVPEQPSEEFGQDAFPGVVQPCFALVARARPAVGQGSPAPWVLAERARHTHAAVVVTCPDAVMALADHPRLPGALFGEWGFRSGGRLVADFTVRATAPTGRFTLPLREGRDVGEFHAGPAGRYLDPDPVALAAAHTRLRAPGDWARVAFVVRQTARHPVAALTGDAVPFRNSLLAGFDLPGWDPALVVALLNSTLLRAVHRAGQRDGRQKAFPQVKMAHLRGLPAPRARDPVRERTLMAFTHTWTASAGPLPVEARRVLDETVCGLYGVAPTEAERDALRAGVG